MTDPQDPYAGQPYQPYQPYPGYNGQPPAYPAYPAYPPPGYPAYPPPGYPVHPGYPGYAGYPGWPPAAPPRPSSTTGSAVLAFVTGGLLVVAGLILVVSASFTDSFSDFDSGPTSISTELAVDGIIDLFAAMALIVGGVMLLGGNRTGRKLIFIGSVVVVVAAIYWILRPHDAGETLVPGLIFAALAVVAVGLLNTSTTHAWLAAQPPPAAKV